MTFIAIRQEDLNLIPTEFGGKKVSDHVRGCAAGLLNYIRNYCEASEGNWLIKTIADLQEVLFGLYKKDAIAKARELLVALGLIEVRHHWRNGRMWIYRFLGLPESVTQEQLTVTQEQTTVTQEQTTVDDEPTTVTQESPPSLYRSGLDLKEEINNIPPSLPKRSGVFENFSLINMEMWRLNWDGIAAYVESELELLALKQSSGKGKFSAVADVLPKVAIADVLPAIPLEDELKRRGVNLMDGRVPRAVAAASDPYLCIKAWIKWYDQREVENPTGSLLTALRAGWRCRESENNGSRALIPEMPPKLRAWAANTGAEIIWSALEKQWIARLNRQWIPALEAMEGI